VSQAIGCSPGPCAICSTFRTVAMTISASMIFPRSEGERKSLDEHYQARKRLMIGGVLLVEGAILAWQLTQAVPTLDDYWFWFCWLPYSSR
jgi:hypothetical protein